MLELALARGDDRERLQKDTDALVTRTPTHEDVEEKFWAQLRLLQAYQRLGQPTGSLAQDVAESAMRLDRRTRTDRFSRCLATELAPGSFFSEVQHR